MFQRQLFLKHKFLRYLVVDASPQLGMQFLCIRADRIRLPLGDFGVEFRQQLDLNAVYEERICPVSTLGIGHAGLVKKATHVATVFLMETRSLADFHTVRKQVIGYLSDQGIEKKVSEIIVGVPPF